MKASAGAGRKATAAAVDAVTVQKQQQQDAAKDSAGAGRRAAAAGHAVTAQRQQPQQRQQQEDVTKASAEGTHQQAHRSIQNQNGAAAGPSGKGAQPQADNEEEGQAVHVPRKSSRKRKQPLRVAPPEGSTLPKAGQAAAVPGQPVRQRRVTRLSLSGDMFSMLDVSARAHGQNGEAKGMAQPAAGNDSQARQQQQQQQVGSAAATQAAARLPARKGNARSGSSANAAASDVGAANAGLPAKVRSKLQSAGNAADAAATHAAVIAGMSTLRKEPPPPPPPSSNAAATAPEQKQHKAKTSAPGNRRSAAAALDTAQAAKPASAAAVAARSSAAALRGTSIPKSVVASVLRSPPRQQLTPPKSPMGGLYQAQATGHRSRSSSPLPLTEIARCAQAAAQEVRWGGGEQGDCAVARTGAPFQQQSELSCCCSRTTAPRYSTSQLVHIT